VLALVLLGGSVAGNAASHALTAYASVPPWQAVVVVSAVPPVVLGAVVHLATLAAQARTAGPEQVGDRLAEAPRYEELTEEGGLSPLWEIAPAAEPTTSPASEEPTDRATELIAAGAGRRRLARELEITEHEARALLDAHRNGSAS
jgi:hypothetical protein